MQRDTHWPPPTDWHQVFVDWSSMLSGHFTRPMLDWVEHYHGYGRYQLRGPENDPTSGFLFYFEDHRDAIMFKLKWPQ